MLKKPKNLVYDEKWKFKELCEELDGQFITNTMMDRPLHVLFVKYDGWPIIIEITEEDESSDLYTFISAPYNYLKRDNFLFTIYREGPLCKVGKLLGMQDIVVGFEDFDKDFIVKATNEKSIKRILENKRIRDILSAQEDFMFKIKGHSPMLAPATPLYVPEKTEHLSYSERKLLKDPQEARELIELFGTVLNEILEQGLICEERVHVEVIEDY